MIDIILVTHNVLARTIDCINHIYQNTREFNLTVIDDSTDLTPAWLTDFSSKVNNMDVIFPDKKITEFNQAINLGFENTRSEFVVCMANTISVEPDWLPPLVKVMEQVEDAAIIQPKHLFPHGTIENAGMMFREPMVHHQNVGVGEPGHRMTHIREIDGGGFCLVLMRREAVYPLETGYYLGFQGFDDMDACMTLREKGWKTYYCGYSSAYHYAFSSRGTPDTWDKEQADKYDENRFRFLTRWMKWGEFSPEVE